MSRTVPLFSKTPQANSLHGAVVSGNVQLFEQLIGSGSNVNQKSTDGNYPLCIAAYLGHADIVKLLLEAKADVNAANHSTKWTPCHCAAVKGHGKVLLHLMQYQPDVTLKDSLGRTAVDFASVHDAIWPYFGVLKCQRTSKEDLIRLQVIQKEQDDVVIPSDTSQLKAPQRLNYFSRPGSSYILATTSTSHDSLSSQ